MSSSNKNTQRSSTSSQVCKILARTRIYIIFNSTSFSFTVSLYVCDVCVPSTEAAKSKYIKLIFLKLMSVVSIVHQNLYLSTYSKYTSTVIPGIVSKTFFCVG